MAVPVSTKYGKQVDAWAALVMDRANLGQVIERDVVKFLQSRGLEGLNIYRDKVSLDGIWGGSQENLIIYQNLGKGMHTTVILYMAEWGANDLEIAWRLFEKNTNMAMIWGMSQATLLVVGLGLVALAVLFSFMQLYVLDFLTCGLGVVFVTIAASWWFMELQNRAAIVSTDENKSHVLGNIVDWALRQALVNNGINLNELR